MGKKVGVLGLLMLISIHICLINNFSLLMSAKLFNTWMVIGYIFKKYDLVYFIVCSLKITLQHMLGKCQMDQILKCFFFNPIDNAL